MSWRFCFLGINPRSIFIEEEEGEREEEIHIHWRGRRRKRGGDSYSLKRKKENEKGKKKKQTQVAVNGMSGIGYVASFVLTWNLCGKLLVEVKEAEGEKEEEREKEEEEEEAANSVTLDGMSGIFCVVCIKLKFVW